MVSVGKAVKTNENGKAAALIVLAMILISTNDALIKSASASISVNQILFIRGLLACLIFGAFIKFRGLPLFPPSILDRLNLARGGLEVGATVCFVTALSLLPIATATTLVWTAPIILTVIAGTLLKETVSRERWLAVLVGFTGVLAITQPLGEGFSPAMILPLVASTFVAFRDYLTRRIDLNLHAFHITLTSLVMVTAMGAVISGFDWQPVTSLEIVKLTAAAVAMSSGFAITIIAIRMGELSFIAPFVFSAILMALILGYFVWGDVPNLWTWVGIILIVGACVRIFRQGGDRSG